MSVYSKPAVDTSTSNANWGTIVILLVVIIIGVVVGILTFHPHTETNPVVINQPAAAQADTAPAATTP